MASGGVLMRTHERGRDSGSTGQPARWLGRRCESARVHSVAYTQHSPHIANMAKRAPMPCRKPGCPKYQTEGGYCEEHSEQGTRHYDQARGTAASRGYDRRWRKVRDMKLKRDPMCQRCSRRPATEVHHIVPIADGGPIYRPDNLISYCHPCHMQVHAE